MIRISFSIVAMLILSAARTMAVTTIYSEDFSNPVKNTNTGANGYLGTGGLGYDYNGNFGTWLYVAANMGIDDAAEGTGTGAGAGNAISSIDHARVQDVRGANARAVSMVLSGALFKNGVQYTVSFDVYGDASGNNAGFYWLAEVSGYDNSGSNYIQIDGTQTGWATAKPFTGAGSATVNFLSDKISIDGASITNNATNTVSFTFTYDGSNSPDIGFSVGTYNNIFGIDNVEITTSGAVYDEDFSNPAKSNNSGANGYLGTGGAGYDYNGNFGTWLYAAANMGIDDPAEGDESGTGTGNAISSIDHARVQDVRGLNARAVSMVLNGGLFENGVQYTVSFDVYGDASGNDAGFYWLAELSGYDNSGSNYIQIDGTQTGWATAKPFTGTNSATVNFLSDKIAIDGENTDATNTVSFTFTYDASNSPDIGFAVGTYNNIFGIDNVLITREVVTVPYQTLIDFGGNPDFYTNAAYQAETGGDEIIAFWGSDIFGRLSDEIGTLKDQGVGGSLTSATYNVAITTVAISSSNSARTNTVVSSGQLGINFNGSAGASFAAVDNTVWTFEFNDDVWLAQVGFKGLTGAEKAEVIIGGVTNTIVAAQLTSVSYGIETFYTFAEPVAIAAGTDITITCPVGQWGLGNLLVGVDQPTVVPVTYDSWVAQYPTLGSLTNLNDNYDGDALNNLYEFAQGGNPTNADAGNASVYRIVGDTGTNYFEYVYYRRKDYVRQGLTYELELTESLTIPAWTNVGYEVTGTGTYNEDFRSVTNRVPSIDPAKFIQLQIDKN